MSDDLVKRAHQALDSVTPGPWATHMVDETTIVSCNGIDVGTTCDSTKAECEDAYNNEYERMEADARFIAASRELVPAMADRIEELEAQLAKAVEALVQISQIELTFPEELRPTARAALAEINGGGDT